MWIRTRIGHKSLAEIIASAERMLPDDSYENVLIYARDRITGTLEQDDHSRWMEAALAVHQRAGEPLTSVLERLEGAINELQANLPEQASPELIYFIYRAT